MAQLIHFLLLFTLAGLSSIIMSAKLNASSPTEADSEQVLFRKQLDEYREIVVVREQSRPLAILKGITIIPEKYLKHIHGVFSVRFEVRSANTVPLTLFTRLVYDWTPGRGFEVFDMLVSPGQLVIASAEGSEIMLWRINPIRPDVNQFTVLRGYDWTRVAAAVTLDKSMVSVKLTWTKDHLVEAAVDDLRPNFKRHTRFIQSEKEWKFMPHK